MTRTSIPARMRGPARPRPAGVLAALGWLLAVSAAGAATWRVPGDASTIGTALAAAAAGDTVEVACGTYLEHGLVVGRGVTLRGASGDPSCVVIDADRLGRALDVDGSQGMVTIEGVTIRGGHVAGGFLDALGGGIRCLGGSVRLVGCRVTANTAVIGGGFGADQASVELVACDFTGNAAEDSVWAGGGGVWLRGCTGQVSACTFTDNTALAANPADPGDGGGMFVNSSRLQISDTEFRGNSAGGGAGGLYTVSADSSRVERCLLEGNTAVWGGGLYVENAATQLTDCTIDGNTAGSGGGALIGREAGPRLDRCTFRGNTAATGSGGGIDSWQSWPDLLDCLFEDNSAATAGGGMHCGGTRPDIVDCVFLGNTAGNRGGALSASYANIRLTGGTLAGNGAPLGGGISSAVSTFFTIDRTLIAFNTAGGALHQASIYAYTFTNSDIYGNAGGDWTGPVADLPGQDGNFSADPLFCGFAVGDLRLDAASPCAPGSVGPEPVGAFGVGCALSAAAPTSATGLGAGPAAPNPFNPATTIPFRLQVAGQARVTVHDVAGRLVRTLLDGPLPAGSHVVRWDGRDGRGRLVAAGSYLYRVTSGDEQAVGRMTMVK